MSREQLEQTAGLLVADGKGILAADETVHTLTKRFAALNIESTADTRRNYREIFFTTPNISSFIGGVILQDETIRQKDDAGTPLAEVLSRQGVVPGIKVDNGAKPLAGSPEETVTEGLDGLRDRLKEYAAMGAKFAKWRAVIRVSDAYPRSMCISANAHALARYAALCQEQDMVPIVEPEVLMNGSHTLERCEEVTGRMLEAVFHALYGFQIGLEGMVLKPNMVTPGKDCGRQASVEEVAAATLRCLQRQVPAAVPGVVFLSGGQSAILATSHLDAINKLDGVKPWKISFSYGRALQDPAMQAWRGNSGNVKKAQAAFYRRAKCNSAAALGRYSSELEAA